MSILIDTVRIAGFRGIENLEISLPRVAVLIGTNNSGKTSVIKALQLALGDYSRYLTDEDFRIDQNDKRCEKIIIDTRIISFDHNTNTRNSTFDDDWMQEFEDKIQSEANGEQFLAIRTESVPDDVKGGFTTKRYALERWLGREDWVGTKTSTGKQLRKRIDALPFISIDAQRDIHQELKEKSSFVGKVLSSVKYNDTDVKKLEKMVAKINQEAVDKSEPLKQLKSKLDSLNQSFAGSGKTELTPFPKKIRDLSKQFSVHYGETEKSSFSMEYHGMGTRSWASMLAVKAFSDLMASSHEAQAEPYHPIMAAEEPEAHLHPNAQRTLYQQLVDSKGQVIISSHSPYLAALAKTSELRYLQRRESAVSVNMLRHDLDDEDVRKIYREVIHSRGELLFANAIVLSEGETEEQALPQLFYKYFDQEPFSLGINFIGVSGSGAKYRPFLLFAKDFNIPVFVFSDGEKDIVKQLKKHYEKVFGVTDLETADNITILEENDFEGYLLESGFSREIENAITKINGSDAVDKWIKKREGTSAGRSKTDLPPCGACNQPIFEENIRDYTGATGRNKAMLEILDSKKPMYAQAVTEELCKMENGKLPDKIQEFFKKLQTRILV